MELIDNGDFPSPVLDADLEGGLYLLCFKGRPVYPSYLRVLLQLLKGNSLAFVLFKHSDNKVRHIYILELPCQDVIV